MRRNGCSLFDSVNNVVTAVDTICSSYVYESQYVPEELKSSVGYLLTLTEAFAMHLLGTGAAVLNGNDQCRGLLCIFHCIALFH